MLNRIRLLPVLICAAVLLFGVKVERLWRHGEAALPVAQAQEKKPDAEAKTDAANADGKGEAGKEAAAGGSGKPVQTASTDSDSGATRPGRYSPSEVAVLQKLSARREQLDVRSAELDVRENLLQAAEKRLEEKVAQLKDLESRIQALLKKHDDEAEKKLASLVKIYETMKAKDAAAIFEQLDLDILLDVVERMKEAKMAPILANMDPARAKELTVELALRRKLPVSGG